MKVKGVYADEHQLPPEQWVNVWRINHWGNAVFHSTCQVKDLKLEDLSEYALEFTEDVQ